MFTKKRVLLVTAAIIIVLLAGFVLIQALAADTDSYAVEVKYYDNMANTYKLIPPGEKLKTTTENVPVGGLRRSSSTDDYIIGQVYCIDPFTPFGMYVADEDKEWKGNPPATNSHDTVNKNWGPLPTGYAMGTYKTDGEEWGETRNFTKRGYYPAAPWASSNEVQKHRDAILWLVYNGYRGDFRGDDAESQASIARLNAMYPSVGGDKDIDKTVAVMATKVALWKIVTYDMKDAVTLEKSYLEIRPEWQAMYFELIEKLINDAMDQTPSREPRLGELSIKSITKLSLEIDDAYDPISKPLGDDGTYVYYGPLTVTANVSNLSGVTEGDLDFEDVFLTVDGSSKDGVSFVTGVGGADLPAGMIPGTNQNAQCIKVELDGGGWKSGEFYLKVPKSRANASGTGTAHGNLTVNAKAMVPDVPVVGGTPIVLVYQYPEDHAKAGIQDWTAVQAFVGAAMQGKRIDLYADASTETDKASLGALNIFKRVENPDGLTEPQRNQEFTFWVLYKPTKSAPLKQLLLQDFNVEPAGCVDKDHGCITLKSGELARIDHLPVEGYYVVMEQGPLPGEFRDPHFVIPFSRYGSMYPKTPCIVDGYGNYWSDEFQIDNSSDIKLAFVAFYNTIKSMAHIQVGKVTLAYNTSTGMYTPTNVSRKFEFRLDWSDDDGKTWRPYPLSPDNFIYVGRVGNGGIVGDGGAGRFELYSLEQAFIDVNPLYSYRVVEVDPGDGWETSHAIVGYSPCDDAPCDDSSHKDGWHILDIRDTEVVTGPGPRETQFINVEEDGSYLFLFDNYEVHDLSIKKTVTGGATATDRLRMFRFEVFAHAHIEPRAVRELTPVALSEDGRIIEVEVNGEKRGLRTYVVEIRGADNELIADIGSRIIAAQYRDLPYEVPYILELKHNETATIKNLPDCDYEVHEVLDTSRYIVSHTITSGGGAPKNVSGTDAKFMLARGDTVLEFKNDVPGPGRPGEPEEPDEPTEPGEPNEPGKPSEPGEPGKPDEPDEPGKPDEPDEPGKPDEPDEPETPIEPNEPPGGGLTQTGDVNGTFSAILMLILGFGCLVTAEFFRRSGLLRKKKSSNGGNGWR